MMGLRGESMNPMTFGNMIHPTIFQIGFSKYHLKSSFYLIKGGILSEIIRTHFKKNSMTVLKGDWIKRRGIGR